MLKKYIPLLFLSALFFSACTDTTSLDEIGPVVKLGTPPNITAGPDNLVFEEANEENAIPTITWSAADFGFSAATNYEVQIDVVGNNFSKALSLGQTNDLSLESLTVASLNNLLFAQGFPELTPLSFEYRIVATISNEIDALISPAKPLNVTLYEVIIIYPKLHLPGDYQEWDPATEVNVIFSLLSNKKYEGFNYYGLDNAVFKFTDGPSWDVNWGDEEPDGKLDAQGIGNDIPIGGEAGVYFLQCNINTLTYSIEPANMSVYGGATDNEDINFDYDTANNWLTLTTDLSAGAIRFRANGDNVLSLGDNDDNGKLQIDGANISIAEAGNYTINLLILNEAEYKYELIKN